MPAAISSREAHHWQLKSSFSSILGYFNQTIGIGKALRALSVAERSQLRTPRPGFKRLRRCTSEPIIFLKRTNVSLALRGSPHDGTATSPWPSAGAVYTEAFDTVTCLAAWMEGQ